MKVPVSHVKFNTNLPGSGALPQLMPRRQTRFPQRSTRLFPRTVMQEVFVDRRVPPFGGHALENQDCER